MFETFSLFRRSFTRGKAALKDYCLKFLARAGVFTLLKRFGKDGFVGLTANGKGRLDTIISRNVELRHSALHVEARHSMGIPTGTEGLEREKTPGRTGIERMRVGDGWLAIVARGSECMGDDDDQCGSPVGPGLIERNEQIEEPVPVRGAAASI